MNASSTLLPLDFNNKRMNKKYKTWNKYYEFVTLLTNYMNIWYHRLHIHLLWSHGWTNVSLDKLIQLQVHTDGRKYLQMEIG